MTTLSVVIPAYNEEDGIEEIAQRVLKVKEALTKVGVNELELLVVNDGSRDRTAEIAGNIPGVTLVSHPKNKGYGAALKTGFGKAKGELIAFLDADGTYPPEYFPQLCQEVLRNGSQLVVGSRRSGAESHMPPMRRLGNFIWSNLVTLLGGQKVIDPASGMRVFRREILEQIYPLPDGLNLTPVMSTRAVHEGVKMKELPIPYSERLGRSKLSVVRDGSIFLQSMVWTALTYNPVRILGIVGAGGVGIAFLVALGLVIARLSGVNELGPWGVAAVFLALVAGVIGVNLFALGTTFNYLVTLFIKRPIRQGLFGRPVFKTPLEKQFGWIGATSFVVGTLIAIVSLVVGIGADDIARLWLYLLGGAMLSLVGVQLMVYWILSRVLEELSQREAVTQESLRVS
ncbi:MAG: glycosyltransferase family 2 protein [Chloroflexi bacterium]|nr:glycosyltransferase family 2 protein [Chloroflexota bacterium]MBP8059905.1 glycosyltransferase family 2 protein [Chloroflexota bacterium]